MSYKSVVQESFPLFYYQLNEYSGNFKEASGRASATPIDKTQLDLNFSSVLLLMHMNSFVDVKGNATTPIGNATISTSDYKVGTGSAYFDGSGDGIDIANSLSLGTGDFTIECWFKDLNTVGTLTDRNIIGGEFPGTGPVWGLVLAQYNGYDGMTFAWGRYGSYTVGISTGWWPPDNLWHHVAVVRTSGVIAIYIDGVSKTLTTYNEGSTFNPAGNFNVSYGTRRIGANGNNTNPWYGNIDELRISKVARYTGNFTPSTTPFPDNGTIRAFGYNSYIPSTYFNGVDFNGYDDYIDLGISLSPNTFSIEFWLMTKPSPCTDPHIVAHAQKDLLSNSNQPFSIKINPEGTQLTANFSTGVSSSYDLSLGANLIEGQVYHVAVSRNGVTGACSLYINGTEAASGVLVNPLSIYATKWRLGAAIETGASIGTTYASCSIAEMAIYDSVIDPLVFKNHYEIGYTSTFRPPSYSDPYLNLTSLLIHGEQDSATPNTPIDSRGETLQFQGTAGFSTAVKKFGNSSFSLGTAGNISAPSGVANFGTGDFTMEAWVYFNSTANRYASIFGSGQGTFQAASRALMLYGDTETTDPSRRYRLALVGYNLGQNNDVLRGETIIKTGRWYHIALCRFSGVTKLYVNGDLDAEAADTNSHDFSSSGFLIGKNGWNGSSGYLNGYIDEIRVTKGICRYTTNFETEAAAFPDYQLYQHRFIDYDSKFDQVSVLLHGDKFADMSNNALTLTTAGSFTANTTLPKIGTSSFKTTANADYASVTGNALYTESPTWTAECWIKPTTMQDSMILDWRPDATEGYYFALGMTAAGNIRARVNSVNYDTSFAIDVNEWWHIAVSVKNLGVIIFINGVPALTFPMASWANSNRVLIAANAMSKGTAGGFIGYISEIRITKNTARYIGPFELQTLPFRDRTNNTWTQFTTTAVDYQSIDLQFPPMVPAGTDVADPLNINLVIGTFKLSGRALRADGQAASFVSIHSTDGLYVATKTPDTNGNYEFTGLDGSRQYYILVDAGGSYQPKALGPFTPDAS